MSFRRFVNLVASDFAKNNYTLRRIDMSRFFLPTKDGSGRSLLGQDPPPVEEDCRLPDATMNFYPPQRVDSHGKMDFMLLKNKVVATNEKGHALMYDPDMPAFHHLPLSFAKHKSLPISIAVGNNLYILDRQTSFNNGNSCRSFEALVYRPLIPQEHGWEWRTLPPMRPPPFVRNGDDRDRTCVTSLAAVQGGRRRGTHIWVSAMGGGAAADGACTYSFDTRKRVWSNPADWSLPFCGVAEYVPELQKLWFSSRDQGSVLCASDLAAASFSQEHCRPPVLHEVFDDDVAGSHKGWRLLTSHAVHLGSGKFCIARFFDRSSPNIHRFELWDNCIVFAGVEVLSCDGKLHMVKHRSERYMFLDEELHVVL